MNKKEMIGALEDHASDLARRPLLTEERHALNARIRAAASWPSARGVQMVEERDERGRFVSGGGFDQGQRGGSATSAKPHKMNSIIRGFFGIGDPS